MLKLKRRAAITGLVLLTVAVLLVAFSSRILWSLGAILDNSESPRKADMIVVIGGDYRGSRVLKAAELVRDGYAPKVLISGVEAVYGHYESDLAVDLAVAHGYPREEFIPFHYPALSTADEARADVGELRRLGAHSYLLVTSPYHTARASRAFRRESAGLEFHTVSAPDLYWGNGEWWKNREGRKIWFFETVKTMADSVRL